MNIQSTQRQIHKYSMSSYTNSPNFIFLQFLQLVRLTWWNHLSGLPRVPISSSEEEKRLKNELIREEKQKQAAISKKI